MKSHIVIGLSIIIAGAWFGWGEARFSATISTEFVAIVWMGIVSFLSHNELSKLLIKLTSRVENLEGGSKNVTQSSSPISLTDYGQNLSEIVGAKAIAQNYAGRVEFGLLASEYHIQEVCSQFAEEQLLDNLTPDERSFLETIAYQEGIDIKKILRVIGIEMRDFFLAQRKKEAGE